MAFVDIKNECVSIVKPDVNSSLVRLSEMQQTGLYCDVVLRATKGGHYKDGVEYGKVMAHGCFLAAASEVFAAMIEPPRQAKLWIQARNFDMLTLRQLSLCIDYIYGRKVQFLKSEVQGVTEAAEVLQITTLLTLCKRIGVIFISQEISLKEKTESSLKISSNCSIQNGNYNSMKKKNNGNTIDLTNEKDTSETALSDSQIVSRSQPSASIPTTVMVTLPEEIQTNMICSRVISNLMGKVQNTSETPNRIIAPEPIVIEPRGEIQEMSTESIIQFLNSSDAEDIRVFNRLYSKCMEKLELGTMQSMKTPRGSIMYYYSNQKLVMEAIKTKMLKQRETLRKEQQDLTKFEQNEALQNMWVQKHDKKTAKFYKSLPRTSYLDLISQDPISQDRISQDLISQDPISQDPISQDPISQDPISQDPISQDPISQDPISQDPTSQYPTSQYPTSQYLNTQYPISQYPISQYPISQYPISQYPINQDPTSQYPTSQYPTIQDLISQDLSSQYPISQYPVSQDPISQDPISQDPISQDPVSQDPISQYLNSQDRISRGLISQDPVGQDPSSQYPVSQDLISQDPISQDPVSQDPISQDPTSQYLYSQDPISRDLISQDLIVQDPISRDPSSQHINYPETGLKLKKTSEDIDQMASGKFVKLIVNKGNFVASLHGNTTVADSYLLNQKKDLDHGIHKKLNNSEIDVGRKFIKPNGCDSNTDGIIALKNSILPDVENTNKLLNCKPEINRNNTTTRVTLTYSTDYAAQNLNLSEITLMEINKADKLNQEAQRASKRTKERGLNESMETCAPAKRVKQREGSEDRGTVTEEGQNPGESRGTTEGWLQNHLRKRHEVKDAIDSPLISRDTTHVKVNNRLFLSSDLLLQPEQDSGKYGLESWHKTLKTGDSASQIGESSEICDDWSKIGYDNISKYDADLFAAGDSASKPGVFVSKSGDSASKPGVFESKASDSASKSGDGASKPGVFGSKSSDSASKTGVFGSKFNDSASKPGVFVSKSSDSASKPGVFGSKSCDSASKTGVFVSKSCDRASKSGVFGSKSSDSALKPGVLGSKFNDSASKPGDSASKPGVFGSKSVDSGSKPGVFVSKSSDSASKPGVFGSKYGDIASKLGVFASKSGDSASKSGAFASKYGYRASKSGVFVSKAGDRSFKSGAFVSKYGYRAPKSGAFVAKAGDCASKSGAFVAKAGDSASISGVFVVKAGDSASKSGFIVSKPNKSASKSSVNLLKSGNGWLKNVTNLPQKRLPAGIHSKGKRVNPRCEQPHVRLVRCDNLISYWQ